MVKLNDKSILVLILTISVISLFLNIYGIWWGLPLKWHPDEPNEVDRVISMAKNLDPNPHWFHYPSFHKYILGIVLSPYFIYIKLGSLKLSNEVAIRNIYLTSRLISAVMGTLTVFLVYLVGKEIYNEKVGLISSAFLACTMGFVNYSHFATVDISLTLLILVSIFFFVKITDTGKMRYYLLGGLFAGLALSTKYTAILLILPMFVSHFISQKQKWFGDISFNIFARGTYSKLLKISFNQKFIYEAVMMVIGFIIGTPFSILDFSTFKEHMFTELFSRYQGYKGFSAPSNSWVLFISYLKNTMGLPLLLICSIGTIYLVYKFVKKDEDELSKSKYTILLFSWMVPYYIIIGSWSVTAERYIIPIIPILAIFGGKFIYEMIVSSTSLKKNIMCVVFGVILIYSFGYSLTADHMYIHDSRYAAGEWLDKNVDINSTIEVYDNTAYLPPLPKNVTIFYPPSPDIGHPPNQTYIEQYDNFLKGLEERKPDYIVLTSFYYERYLRDRDAYPYRTMFFSNLLYGNTNYTLTAIFGNETIDNPILQTIGQPKPFKANPTILILKRESV